jgi:filamentous hemagglutinin
MMEKGRKYSIVKRNVAIAMLLAMLNSMLFADIKVDRNIPQKTSVDRAQNGANIININTPNGKGISVNDFSEFRTKDPTVFNNFGQGVGRSYLAGMMASNPNLTKEQAARLILNRVGGNNRVEIENWLEVMSENKTDLIFSANQGFYLNNTGFINFDKVMFTTSRVDLDGNGDLLPFNIRGGKIEIGREGINAEGVRYLAFLSKQISIDGQVYAKDADVDLIAGDFDYNPNTREYTKQGTYNNELLISSSAFGSMYGNQIKIVAVNGNVGVAGDNIAQKVLKINADGTIVTNKNQGNEGIEIKGKEFTQNSSTYTEGNLTIEADKTILKGNGTQAGNILITGELENEVNIYSGTDINIGKGLVNKSGQIVAERNISVNSKVDNKDLLYAKNSITIGKELNNTGNIQSNGSIKTGGDTVNTGKILSENELTVDGKLTSTGTVYGKNKVEVKDKLDNSGDIQSEGNISVGSDTKNTGRIISDKNIEISGNLETEETVYAKENLNVKGNLVNKKDIQAEGNITVEKDTINQGRLLSDKELNIKGNTNNSGTLYGKDRISLDKNLANTGTIQTSGDLTAKDTINTGKIVSEGNVSLNSFDNSGELTINKKLTTTALENKTGAKINTGEGIQSNGVRNYGEINSNSNFLISGNLENYNIMNIGGLLTANDLLNTGNLKAVDKIYTSGISFNNSGEILTTLLDINSTGIINTNKITVIDDVRLNGNTVTNNGTLTGKNISITTSTLSNSGEILAAEKIIASNTNLTNTGKLASNEKIEINNSNIVNRSIIESTTVNMGNMFSYDNNTGIIRGNNISLSSTGNLLLEGSLKGTENVLVSGLDITNNGILVGSDLLRLSGRDIINNTAISGSRVEVLGTGNILNNSMIEGETGKLSGNNIINKDLIIFLNKLDIEGTKLINNEASVYSDNELNIKTGDVDNTSGEIVGQNTLNITGFNLLDNTKGIIDSRGNILLSGNKLLNSGEVSGQYRLYWKTWDGQYIYDVWRELGDVYALTGNSSLITGLDNWYLVDSYRSAYDYDHAYEKLLGNNSSNPYSFYYSGLTAPNVGDPSKKYETKVLEGYVDTSKLVTEGGRILSGGNLTLDVKEVVNRNSKISSGGTLRITDKVEKIENITDVATIKVYDGNEVVNFYETYASTGGSHTITYYNGKIGRELSTISRDYNIADSVSVIEGNNVIIEGTPTINNGYDYSKIGTGAVVDPSTITSKDIDVDLYYDPVTVHVDQSQIEEVARTGIIPFDYDVFLGSISKLFVENSKEKYEINPNGSTSKYLIETRSQYIDLSRFYGSDYFLSRIGYNESKDWNNARRLGDAYYETKYMNNLLLESLGTRFINGKADTALMKEMLDNAVATSGDLQLTIGVALTSEQITALKSDIIWYVEQEVNGEKVLVPQVYLSQATLENLKNPTTTISAQETLAINSSTLTNQGRLEGKTVYVNTENLINKSVGALTAEITGTNIQINAKNDILNIGAVISAKEDLILTAGGTISNVTTGIEITEHDRLEGKERTRIYDDIQNVGVISSGNTTYIESDKYVSRGAVTESGGTTYIEANDVNINTIALKDYERTEENHGYDLYRTTEKLGSEVTGLDNVIINAGNDINIKGSTVASDGTVQLTAENNINIENDKNTVYTESKRDKKGTFTSYSKLETNYQEGAVASTLIGNNVILEAGNDVNVKASNVIAVKNDNIQNSGGNIIVTAGNDINITTDDLNNEYYLKEKKSGFSTSFSSGGGGLSAGVSYSKNSLENERNSTIVATSSIVSEGNTILNAGNRVKTEAMQANVGENLIIRGVNGVELLDAQEVYNEKVKQKSTTIGVNVNVAFTPAQMASTVSDVISNSKDYGFGNTSQSINTIGNGVQDLKNVTQLGSKLYDATLYGAVLTQGLGQNKLAQVGADKLAQSNNIETGKEGLLNSLVSASVTASYSRSSYESNTSGTTSVAGNINVGNNFIIQSDGDVKLVNQKVTIGNNFLVDAKNFEARAGENTYSNDTKSSSAGISAGYDIINKTNTVGINVSGGKSNTDSKYYDNTTINVGGTFQLTTKENANFIGANVIADKINFDIGKDLNIISLQDEYKSKGSSWGAGIDVSANIPGTNQKPGYAIPSLNGSYSQNNADSKWVNNQTSIIAENGGSIKVGETLTNTGAIIGSLNPNEKLSVDANKIVVENLKDHDKGENSGIQLSGISKDTLIPQTGIQYGSHDKQQDSNATFVNTEIIEAGKKLDLDELGINTDISKAQVITKDEVVDQIDTVLHTDLGNQKVRDQFVEDILKTGSLVPEIVQGIKEGTKNDGETVAGQIANNLIENKENIHTFVTDRENKQREKNQEILDKNNGKITQELLDETTKYIKETLDAAGKGDYTVVYSSGGNDPAMSIDDGNKIIVVNVDKTDFTDTESIRKNAQHESVHNRYVDQKTDENTAGSVYNGKDKIVDNKISDNLKEQLNAGKELYDEGVANGQFRDKSITELITGGIQKRDSYKSTEKEYTSNGKLDIELIKSDWHIDDEGANRKVNDYNNKDGFVAAIESSGEMLVVSLFLSPIAGIVEGGISLTLKTTISMNSIPTRDEQYIIAVAMIKEAREKEAARINNAMKAIIYTDQLIDSRGNVNRGNLSEYNKAMEKSGNKHLKLSESDVKSIYNKTVTYQKSKDPDVYFRAKSFSLKTFFSSQSNREIR